MRSTSVHVNASGRNPSASPAAPCHWQPSTSAASKLLGIWRLGELMHEGPYSQLWSAQPADSSGSPRWDYVLKTVPPRAGDPVGLNEAANQLKRFAAAAAAARHPHLVVVLDAAMEGSEPFLVMPRLGGAPLAQLLSGGEVQPLPVVLWLVRQVAQAAGAMHAAGLVHHDIHAGNVMVSSQGHATLVDLGFARPVGQMGDGVFRGTASYAAPEQLQSEPAAASPASDVFSLGRLLWQLLSLTAKDQASSVSIDAVADLVAEMVDSDPASRPSAQAVADRLMRLEIETLGQHFRPQAPSSRRAA